MSGACSISQYTLLPCHHVEQGRGVCESGCACDAVHICQFACSLESSSCPVYSRECELAEDNDMQLQIITLPYTCRHASSYALNGVCLALHTNCRMVMWVNCLTCDCTQTVTSPHLHHQTAMHLLGPSWECTHLNPGRMLALTASGTVMPCKSMSLPTCGPSKLIALGSGSHNTTKEPSYSGAHFIPSKPMQACIAAAVGTSCYLITTISSLAVQRPSACRLHTVANIYL